MQKKPYSPPPPFAIADKPKMQSLFTQIKKQASHQTTEELKLDDPKDSVSSTNLQEETELYAQLLKNQDSASSASSQKKLKKLPGLKNCLCDCPEILVADDIAYNRFALMTILESEPFGFSCLDACNGEEAVRKMTEIEGLGCSLYKKHCLKVVIMDYEMPGMNGIEATKILVKKMKRGEM